MAYFGTNTYIALAKNAPPACIHAKQRRAVGHEKATRADFNAIKPSSTCIVFGLVFAIRLLANVIALH